jgi:hypothetical protein
VGRSLAKREQVEAGGAGSPGWSTPHPPFRGTPARRQQTALCLSLLVVPTHKGRREWLCLGRAAFAWAHLLLATPAVFPRLAIVKEHRHKCACGSFGRGKRCAWHMPLKLSRWHVAMHTVGVLALAGVFASCVRPELWLGAKKPREGEPGPSQPRTRLPRARTCGLIAQLHQPLCNRSSTHPLRSYLACPRFANPPSREEAGRIITPAGRGVDKLRRRGVFTCAISGLAQAKADVTEAVVA